jgi:hypothetical protein
MSADTNPLHTSARKVENSEVLGELAAENSLIEITYLADLSS